MLSPIIAKFLLCRDHYHYFPYYNLILWIQTVINSIAIIFLFFQKLSVGNLMYSNKIHDWISPKIAILFLVTAASEI